MQTFEINEKGFIELNKLLKVLNLVETGGEAHIRIDAGEVKVNGSIETQRRKKIKPGDLVLYRNEIIQIR